MTQVDYHYDDDKRIHSFHGWFGHRIKGLFKNAGCSEKVAKYMFIHLSPDRIVVYDFFIPDLRAICVYMLEEGSHYDVNFVTVRALLDIIDNDIREAASGEVVLDYGIIKKNFIYEPLPAQKPAYDAYVKIRSTAGNRGMLLDGAVGVGKTYISLTLASMLTDDVLLVVAPLPTISRVWINSVAGDECLYKKPRDYYLVGSSEDYNDEKIIIVHYENLSKVIPIYKKHKITPGCLIVDEVHNFNEIKSVRTKLLMDVVNTIPFEHAIPMSGTPIKSKASDLLPLFMIINSGFDKMIGKRFLKVYTNPGYRTAQVLRAKYQKTTVVLKKTDMNIPELTTTIVKAKLKNSDYYTLVNIVARFRSYTSRKSAEYRKDYDKYTATYIALYRKSRLAGLAKNPSSLEEYKSYENDIVDIIARDRKGELGSIPATLVRANVFEKDHIEPNLHGTDKSDFRHVKTIYKYISLKVQGEALANVVMRARIECYSDLIEHGVGVREFVDGAAKKTIIFSNYIEVCNKTMDKAKAEKLNPIGVFGDTSKDLTKQVNTYVKDKKVNPLIATYKSLSTGVPLIVANVIVILGLPHRQMILEQALGRAWRTGQDKPVTAYIVELDTGDEVNITDRDLDIIEYFRKEVTWLTGKDDGVVIERDSIVGSDTVVSGDLAANLVDDLINTEVGYIDNVSNKAMEVIKSWIW